MDQEKQQRIWQIVRQIPPGKVISYGQVATLAGLPGAARLVGYVLKKLPADSSLPWHRVINSQGKIAFPIDSSKYQEQKSLLEAEGVCFSHNTTIAKRSHWS